MDAGTTKTFNFRIASSLKEVVRTTSGSEHPCFARTVEASLSACGDSNGIAIPRFEVAKNNNGKCS